MLNPFTHRGILKKGMPGKASILAIGALDSGARSFNLPMTLQVHVEGIPPYEVQDQWMVKAKDCIGLSGSIPVMVDRDEHDRVAIDWDGVRAAAPSGGSATTIPMQQVAPAGDDPIAKLERLSALRESGALTDEEFEEQKRRILGS